MSSSDKAFSVTNEEYEIFFNEFPNNVDVYKLINEKTMKPRLNTKQPPHFGLRKNQTLKSCTTRRSPRAKV